MPLPLLAHLCKVRQMEQDDLMGTREVAELLGVSIATVNRMAKDGRLTAVLRMPGLRGAQLFHRDQVEAALASDEARTAP
jgi:excisionase family DNA binding protein